VAFPAGVDYDRFVTASDETALIEGVRKGDSQAFETLVRIYGPRLTGVARRILRDEDQAREAVQDAFISAFRGRQQFQGEARLGTWLHRIAVNAALQRIRKARRRPEEPIEDLLPRFLPDGHHANHFPAWTEPPDERLERQETARAVRAAIDQLPETYRTVLMLRDIEEMSGQEVAELLHITPNAVKIRLHRARMALRTLIAPQFEGAAA
jgi:RNA polymerase sigma-70 factor (ECF subfamily)